jgi:hypothetical protein
VKIRYFAPGDKMFPGTQSVAKGEFTPFVLEFLETLVHEQVAGGI